VAGTEHIQESCKEVPE